MSQKFSRKDGPFYQALDKSLHAMNVHRQAYQGGTFVGNHVLKVLKVYSQNLYEARATHLAHLSVMVFLQSANIEALCSSMVAVAEEKCPALLPNARPAYIKFACALSLFAKCHHLYNGRGVTEEDIDQLGTCMH